MTYIFIEEKSMESFRSIKISVELVNGWPGIEPGINLEGVLRCPHLLLYLSPFFEVTYSGLIQAQNYAEGPKSELEKLLVFYSVAATVLLLLLLQMLLLLL